jgi:hypothetical protein
MFPQLSDIEDRVHYRILSRANAIDAKLAAQYAGGKEDDYKVIQNTSGLENTSKLNTWVKAISGAVPAKGNSKGMVLQSIQNWEAFDKGAFGASTNESYYGNTNITQPRSGTIGMDLNGDPIDTSTATTDRMLRPSPIITGLEIKEGQDQISRECTLSIKCFTLGQMEVIQSYFMEPGYTLYIEYGWNTPNLVGPLPFTLFSAKIKPEEIIKAASNRGLNYNTLHNLRVNSNGDFDCFLGFIVGGTVTSEGEIFNVTVNLRGQPGLPTYLQGQHRINKLNPDGKVVKKDPKLQYPPEQVEDEDGSSSTASAQFKAKQRFKYMFNELPAQRQNNEVKNLEITNNPLVSLSRFINLDKTIQSNINHYVDPNWTERAAELFGGDFSDADIVQITNLDGTRVEIDKKDLFSNHKFIKMDLAIRILNANNAIESYIVGGKNVSVKINIDNSVIGGFRYMFSTNPSKLLIPGEMPDFLRYFLNANDITHGGEVGGVFRAEMIDIAGSLYPPVDNSITGVSFVRKTETPASIPYREGPYHWGYLKDLYVNLDLFNTKIQQSNKTISEIFLDILNEMSTAVNSYWNFQIVESKNSKGDIILTVIDENFVGKPSTGARKAFYHSGIQSPFLESGLDLSIPAEMANKLILSRLSHSSNPDSQFAQGGSFFNSKTDLFLQSINPATGASSNNTPDPKESPEDAEYIEKEKLIKEFTDAEDELKEFDKKGYKQVQKTKTDPAKPGQIIYYYEYEDPTIETKAAELRATKEKAKQEYQKITGIIGKSIEGEINERAQLSAKNTASENLKRITLLPNTEKPFFSKEEVGIAITDITKLRTYFRVYTLEDVTYFDMLKQNAFQDKRNQKEYQLSHPLPITYQFKTMGVSGLRRGDMFVIDGIPKKYKNNGVFQITQLEQVVDGSTWTTSVTGKYRQFIQEM